MLIRITLTAAALTLLPLPAAHAAAPAAGTACGASGYFFAGTDRRAQRHYAVTATLTTRVPRLCGAADSDVSVWTMTANGGTGGGYAQSGYGRRAGQPTVYVFAQFTRCGTCAFVHKEVAPPPDRQAYTQLYDFAAGRLLMRAGDATLLRTSFDPAVSWTAPWVPEWEGEAHRYGDDLPGTATARTRFAGMGVKTCRSCGFSAPYGVTASSDSPRYGTAYARAVLDLWTRG